MKNVPTNRDDTIDSRAVRLPTDDANDREVFRYRARLASRWRRLRAQCRRYAGPALDALGLLAILWLSLCLMKCGA